MPYFKSLFQKHIRVIVSVAIGLSLLAGAVAFYSYERSKISLETEDFDASTVLPPSITQPPSPSMTLTVAELGTYDGKNGHDCYVAIDKKVYEIEQGRMWNNGQHDPSEGQAMCGKDLSDTIDKSPHGRSKLTELRVVGSLADSN